jgi:hypothetical protein
MGNCCFKKKDEPYFEIVEADLKQILTKQRGDCNICEKINVIGYDVNAVIENRHIFICLECKNLK